MTGSCHSGLVELEIATAMINRAGLGGAIATNLNQHRNFPGISGGFRGSRVVRRWRVEQFWSDDGEVWGRPTNGRRAFAGFGFAGMAVDLSG